MNLTTEISTALLAAPAVTALVGSDATSARIWNGWERVNACPCIVIEVDDDEEQNDLRGKSDLTISTPTITCRADTDTEAQALWKAVRATLAAYHANGLDLILDDTARSNTPKSEGSTAHWYDRVMSYTALWGAG
jgi:hypothetical protein